LAVGSSVFFNVNGNPYEFIVIQQGNPDSTVYDESCDGTWLLMKNIYDVGKFANSYNSYRNSDTHSYINGTFLGYLDSNIQSAIKQVKIPYTNGNGNGGSLAIGSNGLSTKMFLLSYTEVGFSSSSANVEGVVLDYFNGAEDVIRIGLKGSTAYKWWLRSPYTGNSFYTWRVSTTGTAGTDRPNVENGIRPAFILPSDFDVTNYLA
jgi:hypothetical protein